MAKPIFITRLPYRTTSPEATDLILKQLKDDLGDEYHVLILLEDREKVGFETYNSEGMEPIDIEKLTKLIHGKETKEERT